MIKLPDLNLCNWTYYFLVTFLGSFLIRILNSIWRNLESHDPSWNKFKSIFKGTGWTVCEDIKDEKTGETKSVVKHVATDYWQPFFLGWLELVSYPVLFHSDKASFIGAWLAFKTVHRWSYSPGINRGFYNRYLLSNALVLVISFILAKLLF